jgi:predicted ATPase
MESSKAPYIERLNLEGIHNRYNLEVEFYKNLTVLHGQNGTGKSTLIHIIANLANCDLMRFAYIEFKKIEIFYSNKLSLTIERSVSDESDLKILTFVASSGGIFEITERNAKIIINEADEHKDRFRTASKLQIQLDEGESLSRLRNFISENDLQQLSTSYFPAFRTMLEAWSSQRADRDPRRGRPQEKYNSNQTTTFSRELFGQFLPTINFPSPLDIEERLRNEIRHAQLRIATYESNLFSESFVKVFSALLEEDFDQSQSVQDVLNEISQLSESSSGYELGSFESNTETYKQLRQLVRTTEMKGAEVTAASGALSVYRDALKKRQGFQFESFKNINKFFDVVNSFLDKKTLSYEASRQRNLPKVGLKFPDGSWSPIRVMSSGERQLLTMLYAVNKMSGNSIVLIDEPELSLHIDWQEELLKKMIEQLGDQQIIVCTHSPAIAADFDDHMIEVIPQLVQSESQGSDMDDDSMEEDF